jgi:hypothetical protein
MFRKKQAGKQCKRANALYEKKSKNKYLSVNETIELARNIENAHIVTKKLNMKDETIDNSSLCMINSMKQDQETTCNNSNINNCSNSNNSSSQSFNNYNRNNFKNLQPKQNQLLVQSYNNNQKYHNGRQSEHNDSRSNDRANYHC